jgi:plasmid maintenance system antidote protein VapI
MGHIDEPSQNGLRLRVSDERGMGGQSKLARLLDCNHSTVWRKLNGKSKITQSDAIFIQTTIDRHLAAEK